MAILTIQPSNIDTYLYEGNKGTNFGLLTYVEVRIYNDGEQVKTSRPILKFDFSALPANATITAATLNLYFYAYTNYNAAGRTYWAYELTQTEWVEAEATWNSYKTGSNWTTAGALDTLIAQINVLSQFFLDALSQFGINGHDLRSGLFFLVHQSPR